MSRCFPFPPPGYIMRNGPRNEALIEPIKLQREMEKAKKDRKKEKKEKREKRKEKKERKRKEGATSHASDDGKKFKLTDDKKGIKPDGKLQKVEDYENEQLERSGITEELGQPVSSLEPCCLSDTQSSKRKRSTSLSNDKHGTAIRIRIPLKKHRKTEESKIEHQVGSSCGTSGIADSFTQATGRKDHQLPCVTSEESNQFVGISESRHGKSLQQLVHGDNLVTNNVVDDKRQRMASLYDSLFQIQISPLTGNGFESDDQDWLFGSELKEARPFTKKAKKSATDTFHCSTQSLWPPRAQYLAEAEIYALPYTVPF